MSDLTALARLLAGHTFPDGSTVGGLAKSAGRGLAEAGASAAGKLGELDQGTRYFSEQAYRFGLKQAGYAPDDIERMIAAKRPAVEARGMATPSDILPKMEPAAGWYEPQAHDERVMRRIFSLGAAPEKDVLGMLSQY
jgi:hypothetical protein